MAIKIHYGDDVIVIPQKALEVIHDAGASDIAVLLALLSDKTLCASYGQEGTIALIAKASRCTEQDVTSAVAFWRGAGVLSISEQKKTRSAQATQKSETTAKAPVSEQSLQEKKASEAAPGAAILLKKSDDLPKYTTAELGNLLESRSEMAELLQECQNLFGKLFSTHEVNTLLGLTDYLGLDSEYVLILVTHYCRYCKQQEKRPSVRGLEKLSISLYDRGITDMAALQEELLRQEELQKTESRLRALFGIGARALTAKEKRMFSDWLHTYKFDMEMITKAFEIGMDASPDASVAYIDSILKRWNSENIRTLQQVEEDQSAHEAKKNQAKDTDAAGSFDTDDFFDAAMRKSLGENYDRIMKK